MKKSTLISIVIALIAIAGTLLGLVAYLRTRRCLECDDMEEDYIPDADPDGDYDMDYYVDGHPMDDVTPISPKSAAAPVEDLPDEDITE